MTPKAEILTLLPKLSVADLVEVQTAIKFAGTLAGTSVAPDLHSDWVLNGIASYLIRKGMIPAQGAIQALRRRDSYKGYLGKLAQIMPFLARLEASAGTLTRHRPRLAIVLADALAAWLERRGMLSVSAMLQHIDKIAEAVDESYPGYVEANLFGMILRVER
jgi:hypothetical protein